MAFLGPSKLPCSRIVCGLWQTSGGWGSATEAAAIEAIARLARAGHAFDGADHYGPSEQLMGAVREQLGAATPSFFTKWCPQPRAHSAAEVDAAVGRSLARMRLQLGQCVRDGPALFTQRRFARRAVVRRRAGCGAHRA